MKIKKGVVKKSPVKKPLVVAEGECCFWVKEGPVLKDLKELRDALATMSDDQFTYHLNAEKNDFAKWVEGVLCDKACAKALLKTKTKKGAAGVVGRHLR